MKTTATPTRSRRPSTVWSPPSHAAGQQEPSTATNAAGPSSAEIGGHSFAALDVAPSPSVAAQHKMAASGSGTVNLTYTPEAGDKSTKIVFLQVMRESLDWKVKKPGEIVPSFSYQDADTTSQGFHVDYVSGESDPYYNGDDASDFGVQGNALTSTNATSSDTPTFSDGDFPAGSRLVRWEFRTSAFSAAGADAGRYYGWVDWTFEKEKGKPSKTKVGGSGTFGPGQLWQDAVKLFNKNHGFAMPTYKP